MTKGDGEVYFLEREMKDGLEYIYFQQLLGRTVSMLQTSRSFYDIKSMRLRCMTEAMKSGYELKLFETKKEFFQWCAEQVR